MKAPDWWWRERPTLAASALAPCGALYGALTARRMARPGARAGVPVICVGNLVVGGAGKTPTAIALARMLLTLGARPAFLSRGYGRRVAASRGAVLRVDLERHDAARVGDEPLLLAAVAPTFVAADRRAAADAAIGAGADLLILDDGLQSPALAKDWAVAVVDAGAGVGNGLCLPAGPLRAPVARQWPVVSLLCVVGDGARGDALAALAENAGRPVVRARLVLDARAVTALRGRPLIAFAGIGRPAKFFESLRAAGLDVVASRAFADHHVFAPAEREALQAEAAAAGAVLVTTAKDRVRLPAAFPARAMPVDLVFDDPAAIADALAAVRRV